MFDGKKNDPECSKPVTGTSITKKLFQGKNPLCPSIVFFFLLSAYRSRLLGRFLLAHTKMLVSSTKIN